MYKLKGFAITDVGNFRENNEDNYLLFGSFKKDKKSAHDECHEEVIYEETDADTTVLVDEELDESEEVTALKTQIAAVFDGVGGADNGEVASYIGASQLCTAGNLYSNIEIKNTLKKINGAVRSEIDRTNCVMGSTVSALFFMGDNIVCANLGDSRCYLYRNGRLCQLSHDHSRVQNMIDKGEITCEDAKNSNIRHVITQYLGMSAEINLEPCFTGPLPLEKGDKYLLCSDGLTDPLTDEIIQKILEENEQNKIPLNATAKTLIDHALSAGGRDNVTVVIVDVQ